MANDQTTIAMTYDYVKDYVNKTNKKLDTNYFTIGTNENNEVALLAYDIFVWYKSKYPEYVYERYVNQMKKFAKENNKNFDYIKIRL